MSVIVPGDGEVQCGVDQDDSPVTKVKVVRIKGLQLVSLMCSL